MSLAAYFRSVRAKLFRRSSLANDMDEEIRAHIQHRADDLERSGLDRSEAERHARVEFGGEEKFVEECYEALGANFLDTSIHDVRLSVRKLRKSPGFAIGTARSTISSG